MQRYGPALAVAFIARFAEGVVVLPVIRELTVPECVEDVMCAGTAAPYFHFNPGIMLVDDSQAAAMGAAGFDDAEVSFDANVPYGLDQIDQRGPKPDGKPINFLRDGTGVTIYSLDTGVDCRKMKSKFHACSMLPLSAGGSSTTGKGNSADKNGHGTAMSLVAASVAKNATLIGIPVLGRNGRGKLSDVLLGLIMVSQLHDGNAVPGIILAPLSSDAMGGHAFQGNGIAVLLDQAIRELLRLNVVTVVSAGNKGIDACLVAPAYSGSAITAAGMKKSARRAKFSNYGSCTDLFAPGTGNAGGRTYSGTSVSAGFVAGVAASIASGTQLTAEQVRTALLNNVSHYHIRDARGTPLAFVHAPRKKTKRSTEHIERYKAGAILVVGAFAVYATISVIVHDVRRQGYAHIPREA